MGLFIPTLLYLSIYIAGSQVLLVPYLVQTKGLTIIPTLCLAYWFGNWLIGGLSTWIGCQGRHELFILARRGLGISGRNILAWAILFVSLPASAVTAVIFGSWLLQTILPWPDFVLAFILLALCVILAYEKQETLLKPIQYVSLVFFPGFLLLFSQNFAFQPMLYSWPDIDWITFLALVSYSCCGIRPPVMVETAAYLRRKNHHPFQVFTMAKFCEGILVLALVYMALACPVSTSLPLLYLADQQWGAWGKVGGVIVLLCLVFHVMIPAMTVNAKQLRILFPLSERWAYLVAGVMVYFLGQLDIAVHIQIISFTGLIMMILLIYLAYSLRKKSSQSGFLKESYHKNENNV